MPYITQDRRSKLVTGEINPESTGDYNFLLADFAKTVIEEKGKSYEVCSTLLDMFAQIQNHPLSIITYLNISYKADHADMIKRAARDGSYEFYRVVVGPYEDQKIKENGGVYNVQ